VDAFCPRERILLGIEKPIDDDGITLDRLSSTRPRSFAIDYSRSTVYRDTLRIRKDNFTAIGNILWINGAMPFAQWCTNAVASQQQQKQEEDHKTAQRKKKCRIQGFVSRKLTMA
jgi:hypothetical protein